MRGGLIKRGDLDTETHAEGEGRVKVEAEMGGMCLQAKEPQDCQQLPEAGGEDATDAPSQPLEGTSPAHTLIDLPSTPSFQYLIRSNCLVNTIGHSWILLVQCALCTM